MNFIFTHGHSVADPSEAVQAVTDNGAGEIEIALRKGRDLSTRKPFSRRNSTRIGLSSGDAADSLRRSLSI
jgi:hypothetical protein